MGATLCWYKKQVFTTADTDKEIRLKMLIEYLKNPATPKELKYKISEEFDKKLGPILVDL